MSPVGAEARLFCRSSLNFAPRTGFDAAVTMSVDIRDGRHADLPGWRECGFELVPHASAVESWDDDTVTAIHHAEMEQLALAMTGADHALVSGHIIRNPDEAARHQDLGPITFVHSDFAESYDHLIRERYREVPADAPEGALARNGITADDVASARRMVILQFWRNIGPAKMDFPLGFCDARTLRPDDARPIPVNDYAGSGFDFEALAVVAPDPPERYDWYAFPELRPDEVVAFRTYDSDLVRAGEVFFTPHSAFRDPDVEIGQPARASIELRATCLFA